MVGGCGPLVVGDTALQLLATLPCVLSRLSLLLLVLPLLA